MKAIPVEQRAKIFALVQEGYPTRVVAKKAQVSQSTVVKICQRYAADGTLLPKQRQGRPYSLTENQENRVLRYIANGRCNTAVDVEKTLRTEDNINISANTIRRALTRHGLKARIKRKKPLLRKQHRKARLSFAKTYQNWSTDDWKKVIWSDESKFKLFGSDGKQYCWRRDGEALKDAFVKPTVKFGGGSVMVWGCFTWNGVGNLCKIDGGMDANLYRQILSEDLLETIDDYNLDKSEVVFQHDNDPKHKASIVQTWLVENEINILDWPAQSPDLNPIEHLWDEADRRLRQYQVKISSKEALWESLQQVWGEIEVETCRKLIESLPQRINDVIRAKGGYTRW